MKYISMYMVADMIPKPTTTFPIDSERSRWRGFLWSEVLMADLSLHWWRQQGSHANSKWSWNISNWKKHLLFYPVSLRETRAPKYPSTLCLDEGTSHLFLHVKKWKCCSTGVLNGGQRCSAQWPLDDFTLLDIYCCQLPLVSNSDITRSQVHPH